MFKKIGANIGFVFFCCFPLLSYASIPGFYLLGQLGTADTHQQASNAAALSINGKMPLRCRGGALPPARKTPRRRSPRTSWP